MVEALKLRQLRKGASVSSDHKRLERSRKQSNKCLKLAETTNCSLYAFKYEKKIKPNESCAVKI